MAEPQQDSSIEQPATTGSFALTRRSPGEIANHIADLLEPLRAELSAKAEVRLSGLILSLRILADELERGA